VKYELWYSNSEHTAVLLGEADRSSHQLKARDAQVIWTVEADTYQEAMQKRDEFLELSRQAGTVTVNQDTGATRFTQAMYLDEFGQERSVVTRGWVGMVQPFIDANVDASFVLGQIYFERPGGDAPLDMAGFWAQMLALGVPEITIVDLRSGDGAQRMCQEFHGRMDDPERIRYMIWHRLGPEMSKWNIVDAHVLRTPAAARPRT
jgi:hypothetical protein